MLDALREPHRSEIQGARMISRVQKGYDTTINYDRKRYTAHAMPSKYARRSTASVHLRTLSASRLFHRVFHHNRSEPQSSQTQRFALDQDSQHINADPSALQRATTTRNSALRYQAPTSKYSSPNTVTTTVRSANFLPASAARAFWASAAAEYLM